MNNPSTVPKSTEEHRPAGQFNPEEKNKVHQAVSGATEKVKETASTIGQKTKDAASSVVHSASDLASSAGQKAEGAVSSLGSGMTSLAGTIREKTPHDGMLGTASANVANTLESGGRYLQEQGLRGIGRDVTDLIRRNPIPSVLIALGVGYCIARSLRS